MRPAAFFVIDVSQNWCAAERAYARLYLVFLIKVGVLKPISSTRRFDKGELPGVRSLS